MGILLRVLKIVDNYLYYIIFNQNFKILSYYLLLPGFFIKVCIKIQKTAISKAVFYSKFLFHYLFHPEMLIDETERFPGNILILEICHAMLMGVLPHFRAKFIISQ